MLAFLDHLEHNRGNSVRSRNARLAAIRAFYHYAALKMPDQLPTIQAVLAIPFKRFDRPLLGFLSRAEMDAIIAAPDTSAWIGQRDQMMWLLFYNTGARVSELLAADTGDVGLGHHAAIRLRGKGRKARSVPLWGNTAACLKRWLQQSPSESDAPLLPNRQGLRLTRSGVDHRLQLAVSTAARKEPRLRKQKISPHTIRHTTAMHLLQSGVDITVIALWLGHENPSTTHHYMEADLAMKEKALNTLQAPHRKQPRYKPNDKLLAFLEQL